MAELGLAYELVLAYEPACEVAEVLAVAHEVAEIL